MTIVPVELGARRYEIHVGSGILPKLPEFLQAGDFSHSLVVISDHQVAPLYLDGLCAQLRAAGMRAQSITVPAGEAAKSLSTYETIVDKMVEFGAARDWGVVALGGGMVGDLAGFVAATYMRGIDFIQVPTTLLAQVDASIGGKVGVNLAAGKNLIGAFHQPRLVWIDTAVLRTLPERELLSGFAEVVKYGIIADAELFRYCEANVGGLLRLQPPVINHLVSRSCEIKAQVVCEDEQEHGVRAILNFGHTIGHAIEAAFAFEHIRHGEAIFWGMLIEARIALLSNLIEAEEFARIAGFLARIPLKQSIEGIDTTKITTAILRDKKKKDGKIRFVLPTQIGQVTIVEDIAPTILEQAITFALHHGWS